MLYIEILSQLESDRLNIDEDVKLKLTSLKKSGKRKEVSYMSCNSVRIGSDWCDIVVEFISQEIL